MSDPTPPPPPPAAPPPGPRPPLPGPPPFSLPQDVDPADAELAARLERSARRRRVLLAALGLLVIAGLVASLVVAQTTSSDDDPDNGSGGAPGGDEPGAGGDAGAPADAEPATEAEIDAAVTDISAFVEQARGLEFREPVDIALADEGEFQSRLLEDFDEDADELRKTEVFLEGLGLVEPDIDLVEAMRSLLGGGVVGFYDPETTELVVRGAALTPYVRTTIAHELTHALDDQHFGLDRDQYDDADDEIGFGFSALVEGNARRIEQAYRDSLSEEEQTQADDEELSYGAGIDLGDVPLVLVDLITAPYSLGEVLVDRIVDDGGEDALGAAFGDPPRTSEQVLDPERYLAQEPAAEVPHPEAEGEVVNDGQVGELMVFLVLAEALGNDDAREAADGWGGDWGVAWQDGERSCVTATFVGDDVAETDAMRQAFDRWVAESGDTVEAAVEGDGGRPFTVRSCAA
jgi:hypothetical protein